MPFEFKNVSLPHESYRGINVACGRPRVTAIPPGREAVLHDFPFVARLLDPPPEINTGIKMEVGIEDRLHIEFEYAKAKYLQEHDVAVAGSPPHDLLLVRIEDQAREIASVSWSTKGGGANVCRTTKAKPSRSTR